MVRLALLVLVGACGDPAPVLPAATEGAETEPTAEGEPVAQNPSPGDLAEGAEHPTLSVRLALTRDTLTRADPSNDESARLAARLYVRNKSADTVEINFVVPVAYDLEWTLTAADGTVYQPTFLPPYMPDPDGPPRNTISLPAETEFTMAIATLDGISGFFQQGTPMEHWGPLPAGRYSVVVRGIRLDEGPTLSTPPIDLTVR